jgi:Flp pilus assembly protein TadD
MEASLASYQEAVRLAPEEPRYHNNQGAALARLSRYPEAESAYKRAVSANPNYARPHHNLGDLYVTLGDTSNAIQSYKTFITLWKGTPDYIDLTGRKIDALEGKLIE